MTDNSEAKHIWDRLPDEPDTAYKRFVWYLACGPGRTMDGAYAAWWTDRYPAKVADGRKPPRVSGHWKRDAKAFNWQHRAIEYDIYTLRDDARDAALLFVRALKDMAKGAADAAGRGMEPENWRELIDGVATIGKFIPAETVQALSDYAQRDEAPAVGATPDRTA